MCIGIQSSATAEELVDRQLDFTLQLPQRVVPRPDLVGQTPDIVHAFELTPVDEDQYPIVLLIERMRGTLPNSRLKVTNRLLNTKLKLFTTTWQGFTLDATEVPENIEGVQTVTFNVQIPLKREAIQVRLFGLAEQSNEMHTLLNAALLGLHGKSNWIASVMPSFIQDSDLYSLALMGFAGVFLICGTILFWRTATRTSHGLVLIISLLSFLFGLSLYEIRIREALVLRGTLQCLAWVGFAIGFSQFGRKKRRPSPTQPTMITTLHSELPPTPVDETDDHQPVAEPNQT